MINKDKLREAFIYALEAHTIKTLVNIFTIGLGGAAVFWFCLISGKSPVEVIRFYISSVLALAVTLVLVEKCLNFYISFEELTQQRRRICALRVFLLGGIFVLSLTLVLIAIESVLKIELPLNTKAFLVLFGSTFIGLGLLSVV